MLTAFIHRVLSSQRFSRWLLIGTFVPFCWQSFLIVHELGHVIAAWITGGTITKIVIHPFAISRTDVAPNPNPIAVVWAGPLIGALLPIWVWFLARCSKLGGEFLFRFFAGFCLVANGVYVGVGSFFGIGDPGVMLAAGSSIFWLWTFGICSTVLGFCFWNRLGPCFGLGQSPEKIDAWVPLTSLVLFLSVFFATLFSDRI